MDAVEIVSRAREKLRHKTERFATATLRYVLPGNEVENVPALPAKLDVPVAIRQALATDAAKILAGKWTLFGWREVPVGSPPNWHRDHAHGVEVPADGRNLDHRALPNGANARAIWEMNRWAEMVRLAMHGWLNDDDAAVSRAQGWLANWIESNPVGRGINWTSALEAGLRLINFCWFDALVAQLDGVPEELRRRQRELAAAIVPVHAWWVKRYLSFGSSANNHRLGELTGLLLAAQRWPQLEKISGPVVGLWSEIAGCVLTQFAEDGGTREQALHYHLFAFEMALHACRAMNVSDGPVIERLRHAAEFFVRMSHPSEPWDYGDSDDAQIVPLTMRRERSTAEWRAWLGGAKNHDAAALKFWLGKPEIRNLKSEICRDWWIARESGMAVIERDGWMARVDASPLGFGKLAAHGHCDALHVSIWDGDDALVIDPGTGGYFGALQLREELASWNAHNGPQPARGFRTPIRVGMFLWTGPHESPVLSSSDGSLIAGFSHEEVRYSRTIRVAGNTIDIEDSSNHPGPCRTQWRLGPACRIKSFDEEQGQLVIAVGDRRWLASMASPGSRIWVEQSSASRAFGRIESCPGIEIRGPTPLRMVFHRV
jgi:hypothetical protein